MQNVDVNTKSLSLGKVHVTAPYPSPHCIRGLCRSMAPALVTTVADKEQHLIQTHFSNQQLVFLTTYFISITFYFYINHYMVVNFTRLEHQLAKPIQNRKSITNEYENSKTTQT